MFECVRRAYSHCASIKYQEIAGNKRRAEKFRAKSGKKFGAKFWRKGRFLLVFLLSLMSVRSSCGGVSLGAQIVCAKTPGLTDKQRAMCRAAPAAMAAISDGLRMAYAECVSQMRGRRWNCSGVGDAKHFNHVISMEPSTSGQPQLHDHDYITKQEKELHSHKRRKLFGSEPSTSRQPQLLDHDYTTKKEEVIHSHKRKELSDTATKEAAYTYAITSAGVTHALSAACSAGELPACGCNNRRRGLDSPSWQWGGGRCGEGARGTRLARRFLDARELEHDARALMNLHNNRLGRKMVKEQVVKECKCHGVSGSCSVRTCWRALPPFSAVAGALTQKYLRARKVAAVERGATLDGRVNLQLVVKKSQKPLSMSRPPRKSELVFLAQSPPYCEPAPAAAALGTHQRRCNQTSRGEDSCSHLCCGRGHSTLQVTSHVQCHCSFHWCCKVHCDTCTVTTEHHICN